MKLSNWQHSVIKYVDHTVDLMRLWTPERNRNVFFFQPRVHKLCFQAYLQHHADDSEQFFAANIILVNISGLRGFV